MRARGDLAALAFGVRGWRRGLPAVAVGSAMLALRSFFSSLLAVLSSALAGVLAGLRGLPCTVEALVARRRDCVMGQ